MVTGKRYREAVAEMSLTWTLHNYGWVICRVADPRAEAEAVASYVTDAPEQLLTAVATIVLGAATARVEFQAEPTVYRWTFQRRGPDVEIRLLRVLTDRLPDEAGTLIWASSQPVDALARVVVRAFDAVAAQHGAVGYEKAWGRPFPERELTALRAAWRQNRPG
ncbi:hypothetical protein [Micromonospora sp. NPDC005220]|uniref:hypothetical protein n=1 Tax=Micromonospora sp. NPDC005220 TaxID=3155589 RepID=UPI0033A157EB